MIGSRTPAPHNKIIHFNLLLARVGGDYVSTVRWTVVLLISILMVHGKYLKFRCANLYIKSLFYLHGDFKTNL